MKQHRTPAALLAMPLAALGLAAACSAPFAPARADIFPPAGMNPSASNATLPAARTSLGAAAGSGVNVVTDVSPPADPTGVVDATSAIAAAVAAACNNANPVFQAKEVFIPDGVYLVSGPIPVTNGCWIHGSHAMADGRNAAGAILRVVSGLGGKDLFSFHGFGQLKITDLRIAAFTYQTGGASYARIHTAGTGYVVNDTITLTGGTFTTATVLKVTAVSAGAITGSVIVTPGTYSVAPSSVAVVAQGSTSGVGINATFDVVYANAAAISIAGAKTTLTADAASGATSLTVASIAQFLNGDVISIEQDNGVYLTTTINGAPSGSTITLAASLTFKASANHPVYDSYAVRPLVENVVCFAMWDCVRLEAAINVTMDFFAQDYGHDALIKTSGAIPDSADDRYQIYAEDLNRGTSNAGVEFLSGGATIDHKSKFLGSKYGILVNQYFGPTGTLLIDDSSLEELTVCSIKVHQSVLGMEYGNISAVGNQFSNLVNQSAQHFCLDTGTPTIAPKWVRNVTVVGNLSNDFVTASVSSINIQDGDNIVVAGNALNNNATAGPTGISIGGAATHVVEYGNEIVGFTTGAYGTMQASSLAPMVVQGVALPNLPATGGTSQYVAQLTAGGALTVRRPATSDLSDIGSFSLNTSGGIATTNIGGYSASINNAAKQTLVSLDNADAGGAGVRIAFKQNGSVVNYLDEGYVASHWSMRFGYSADILTLSDDFSVMIGAPTGGVKGSGTLNAAGLIYNNGTAPTGSGGGYVLATAPTLASPTLADAINQEFEVSTSTLTKTSDAALATVPGLSQNLTAGKTYSCRGHLSGVANASGGIKVALVATASLSATSTTWTGSTWSGTTAVANTTVTALGSSIAANTAVYSDVYIDGSIVVNAGGTINVQAAQNASFGTATTVLQGSTFSCVRVN